MSPRRPVRERPASFLTLPREIREKILLLSLNQACDDDLQFNILLRRFAGAVSTGPAKHPPVSAPNIMKRTLVLSMVDDLVNDDLAYVIEICLRQFEKSVGCGDLGGDPIESTLEGLRWWDMVFKARLEYDYMFNTQHQQYVRKKKLQMMAAVGIDPLS